MGLQLTSSSFVNGQAIPVTHTGDGANASPPLAWTNAPAGTKAFALICDDPDAPGGSWVHWVLYDLPPEMSSLAGGAEKTESVLGSAKQGMTDFHKVGYWGPAPPPGAPHRYFYRLYALDQPSGLGARATKKQLLAAIEGHVLGKAELVGTYRR